VIMQNYKIGDLVMHTRSGRYGLVMSEPVAFNGMMAGSIWVCNVAWLDFKNNNLMDISLLKKIEPMEGK
jgi:hypothetical protein